MLLLTRFSMIVECVDQRRSILCVDCCTNGVPILPIPCVVFMARLCSTKESKCAECLATSQESLVRAPSNDNVATSSTSAPSLANANNVAALSTSASSSTRSLANVNYRCWPRQKLHLRHVTIDFRWLIVVSFDYILSIPSQSKICAWLPLPVAIVAGNVNDKKAPLPSNETNWMYMNVYEQFQRDGIVLVANKNSKSCPLLSRTRLSVHFVCVLFVV